MQDLPKSAMFKTMGYSPSFLAKNGEFSTLDEFTRNRHKQSRKELEIILEGLRSRLIEFRAISRSCQNPPCSKPWAITRLFGEKRRIFDPDEFTRNRYKQSRKELEIILEVFSRRLREFGAISRTCQNPPCSKPWAIAQAFWRKTVNFRPLRIHPKSTLTVAQGVRNNFRRV